MAHGKKTGGRQKGSLNKKTLARLAQPATNRPDALDYLAAIIARPDVEVSIETKVRAASTLAAFQHPKPGAHRIMSRTSCALLGGSRSIGIPIT